jgi:tRNA-specific 2-thiouridylase
VLRVEPAAGRVVVGERADLAVTTVELEDVTATDGRPMRPRTAKVRLRAHGTEVGCQVVPLDPTSPQSPGGPQRPGGPQGPGGPGDGDPARRLGGRVRLELDEPVDAVAPGQAGVLYDGDLVLGGGTVTATRPGGDLRTR